MTTDELLASITFTEDPLAIALAQVAIDHTFNAQESINLGYYRTRVTCDCGQEVWWGEHAGDPSFLDSWWAGHVGVKLAEAARAQIATAERDALARVLNPSAFDPKEIYSAETRGAAQHMAYKAADNLIASQLSSRAGGDS